jgi:hypothetical protein
MLKPEKIYLCKIRLKDVGEKKYQLSQRKNKYPVFGKPQ